jgi:N-ethylmaleimide reductase
LLLVELSGRRYGWWCAPALFNESQCSAWKEVVDRVHAKDGVIFLQLWHMGRQSHSFYQPENGHVVSVSDVQIICATYQTDLRHRSKKPRPLSTEEVKQTVQDNKNCAALAKKSDFDRVEVHGANGYLVNQFFQPCTNKREDGYGGSFENRA